MINTVNINPVVRKHKNVCITLSVESLGGRTPTHKVLIYVSGRKTKGSLIECPFLLGLPWSPPPDGGEFPPTSVSGCRRPPRHSWPSVPRGRPRRVSFQQCSVSRLAHPCLRLLVGHDDPPPATHGRLPLYDNTADRVEAGWCINNKRKSAWHTATRGSHSSPRSVSLTVRRKPVVI